MSNWTDFNDAEQQQGFDIIPKGTVVPVRMTIRPGGHDDPSQGWIGGYATRNDTTGSVYLNCEFVILEGSYARRKVWSVIGLHSPKGTDWANMGRSLIRAILNSARGLSEKDESPQAQAQRRISSFADLDGIEFLARIDIGTDAKGETKNEIRVAVTPGSKDWQGFEGAGGHWRPQPNATGMSSPAVAAPVTAAHPATPSTTDAARPANPNRPSWAQ